VVEVVRRIEDDLVAGRRDRAHRVAEGMFGAGGHHEARPLPDVDADFRRELRRDAIEELRQPATAGTG
jgi:hypothetical protein